MKKIFLSVLLLWPAWAQAKINVVATTEDLAAIAREVGGDKVEVAALARGYQDPHFVEAKPSLIVKLMKADLFIEVGLDLEAGWVPPLLQSAGNRKILTGAAGFLDASAGVPLLEVASGEVSRAEGDVHPFGNPHYWMDPANGIVIAENIAKKLSQISPADAALFKSRSDDFKKRLEAAIPKWKEQVKALNLAGNKVITYHKSWSYFAKCFGLEVAGFIEPKPGIPPSPQHLQKITALIKNEKIRLIIVEPYFDAKLPQKIALETGARCVTLPTSVGAEKNIATYFDLFERQIAKITEALKGE